MECLAHILQLKVDDRSLVPSKKFLFSGNQVINALSHILSSQRVIPPHNLLDYLVNHLLPFVLRHER